MSRPSRLVWFGRPTPCGSKTTSISTASTPSGCRRSKTPDLRELAVVFEDIPTYRRYRPGTGPRLRPITLVPVRDTTAYIRDEFFVPPAFSVDGKKRLQYVVGWTDLPAARLQVDAERICDYVSPMAYEEWCAARAAERDEEERRIEEEENVRAVAEAEAREKGIILNNGVRGRRGTKRKHQGAVEANTPPAATAPATGEKKTRGRPRKGVPSLSTPSKSMIPEDFDGLETEGDIEMGIDEEAEERAIFRQLNGEEPMSVEESYDSGELSSARARSDPPTKKRRTGSPRPTLSRLLSSIETDSSSSTPFDSSRGATSSPALPPLPQLASRPRETPILPPMPPASAHQTSTPTAPRTKTQPQKRSLLSIRHPPSTPQEPAPRPQTPIPVPPTMPPLAPATAPPTLNPPPNGLGTTPTPARRPLIQNTTPWTISLAASRNFANLTPSQPIRSIEQAPSATPMPNPAPHGQSPALKGNLSFSAPPATNAGSERAILRTLPPTKDQEEEEEEEEEEGVYEVLRLEGQQQRVIRGKSVRYFLVRWKGNWPAEQNPTWEPESNIPRHLIRNYLVKNPPPRARGAGALHRYFAPSMPRKYSSVSEAFEGGDGGGDEDDDEDEDAVEEGDVEEGDGDEMLLVTDEPPQAVKPTLSW